MAPQCLLCEACLTAPEELASHLCEDHLEENQEAYGELPSLKEGGEIVYLVQVEESYEDGSTYFTSYETGAVMEDPCNLDVVRVEVYEGRMARVILSDGGTPVVYCFPWHKVLHWQEG